MASKTMDIVVVYDKETEEIVGAYTNLEQAKIGIINYIIWNIIDFDDFIRDYKEYLTDFADEFYQHEDRVDKTPDCFSDWIRKVISEYDVCDWNNNILSYFVVSTTPLTIE